MISENRVREVRQQKELSGLEVAYKARIAPGVLSNIENGKIVCYPGWRKRIAAALGCNEADLFPEEVGNR